MEALITMMTFLTVSVAAIVIPRIMIDWQRYREYLQEGDDTSLQLLAAGQRTWIIRHGVCAAGAIVLVALIKCLPGMGAYEGLAGITTAYGMMTLSFAFIESLLAQRVESRRQLILATAKQPRQVGR
ncbi:MAG: hypothetical protein ED859_13120 [Desulfuromonadales bacterium]|nr:MAG: hypothetical protein ED859_13120 [Desulfuromonadales bacterium]